MNQKASTSTGGGISKLTKPRGRRGGRDKFSGGRLGDNGGSANENLGYDDDNGCIVLKKRLLSRYKRDQRIKAANVAAVSDACQEVARLDAQRGKDMQSLRDSQSIRVPATRSAAAATPPARTVSGVRPVKPLPPPYAPPPVATATPAAAAAAGEGAVGGAQGGTCESCADGGDVVDDVAPHKDAAAAPVKGRRPVDETESQAFQPAKRDCIQDTASTPSMEGVRAANAPASLPPPQASAPAKAALSSKLARVVPVEVEGRDVSQLVDLALFPDADALMTGLQRLFPVYDRDEMKLVYLDDEQDCMAVSEYTPWAYFAQTATKLMMISN